MNTINTMTMRKHALVLVLGVIYCGFSMASNDCALLWQVNSNGDQQGGYLFGTIHAEDPRVLELPGYVHDAFAASDAFAMEVVPDAEALLSLARQMHFQGGENLRTAVGEDLYQRAIKALSDYGVGEGLAIKMKPWAVAMTLSVPPPTTGIFLDMRLYLDARNAAKNVYGLETVEEQLSFFEALSKPMQIVLLKEAIDQIDQSSALFDALIETYLSGDLDALEAFNREQMAQSPKELADWLMHEGIERRNLRMRDKLTALMRDERIFAAVGALHLPGEHGLIALLREHGYQVSRLGIESGVCAVKAAALH